MAKIICVFLLLILTGCTPPQRPTYHTKIIYYKPDGEIFKEYYCKTSIAPRVDFGWDGRGEVKVGPAPIDGLPDIPQGWLVELKVRKSYE